MDVFWYKLFWIITVINLFIFYRILWLYKIDTGILTSTYQINKSHKHYIFKICGNYFIGLLISYIMNGRQITDLISFDWLLICDDSLNAILYLASPTQFIILLYLQKVICQSIGGNVSVCFLVSIAVVIFCLNSFVFNKLIGEFLWFMLIIID